MGLRFVNRVSDSLPSKGSSAYNELIYKLLGKLVKRHWQHYHPHYRGEIEDIVSDLYVAFVDEKRHRDGFIYSEADKFDPNKLGGEDWQGGDEKKLEVYLEKFVIYRLINMERSHKDIVNAVENYDEDSGDLTFDVAGKSVELSDEKDEALLQLLFNEDTFSRAAAFIDDNPKDAQRVYYLYKQIEGELSSDIRQRMEDLFSSYSVEELEKGYAQLEVGLRDVLGIDVTAAQYKLQGVPAVRIEFGSQSEAQEALNENQEGAFALLAELGYEFYVIKDRYWYLVTDLDEITRVNRGRGYKKLFTGKEYDSRYGSRFY